MAIAWRRPGQLSHLRKPQSSTLSSEKKRMHTLVHTHTHIFNRVHCVEEHCSIWTLMCVGVKLCGKSVYVYAFAYSLCVGMRVHDDDDNSMAVCTHSTHTYTPTIVCCIFLRHTHTHIHMHSDTPYTVCVCLCCTVHAFICAYAHSWFGPTSVWFRRSTHAHALIAHECAMSDVHTRATCATARRK